MNIIFIIQYTVQEMKTVKHKTKTSTACFTVMGSSEAQRSIFEQSISGVDNLSSHVHNSTLNSNAI